jgi:hypothetical protein
MVGCSQVTLVCAQELEKLKKQLAAKEIILNKSNETEFNLLVSAYLLPVQHGNNASSSQGFCQQQPGVLPAACSCYRCQMNTQHNTPPLLPQGEIAQLKIAHNADAVKIQQASDELKPVLKLLLGGDPTVADNVLGSLIKFNVDQGKQQGFYSNLGDGLELPPAHMENYWSRVAMK